MNPNSAEIVRPPLEKHAELREVFDPLCHAAAEAAHPDTVAEHMPGLFEEINNAPIQTFPTSVEYLTVPYDAATEDELKQLATAQAAAGSKRDSLEAKRAWIADRATQYYQKHPELNEQNHLELGDSLNPDVAQALYKATRSPESSLFAQALSAAVRSQRFQSEDWTAYRSRLAAMGEAERETVLQLQGHRNTNISRLTKDERLAQTDTFVFLDNREVSPSRAAGNIVVPVGEYGEDFAKSLAKTTALMQTVSARQLGELAQQATTGHEDTLTEFTARAAETEGATGETTMRALDEGELSIMQSIVALTCEKVEGYEDPAELVRDLVDSRLVDRLARYSPMGFVGPLALSGKYIQGAVVRKPEGGLAFSEAFEAFLLEKRTIYMGRFVAKYAGVETMPDNMPRPMGRVCPVAGPGLQALSVTFAENVAAYEAQRQ